jgi:hypothetical protein
MATTFFPDLPKPPSVTDIMILSKTMTTRASLLIGLCLFLSACAATPEYGPPISYSDYPPSDPPYLYPFDSSLDFDYSGWGGWHHGWDHSHWGHAGFGHGFAGHAGIAGHGAFSGGGGGGHR